MKVYKLTPWQAETLRGREMPTGATYNVDVKDRNANIVISKEQHVFAQVGEEIEYEPIEEIEI